METAEKVYENSNYRITTSMLNEILSNAVAVNEPPMQSGRRCKIYYMTQADVTPPTFIVFVNDKNLMQDARIFKNMIPEKLSETWTVILEA